MSLKSFLRLAEEYLQKHPIPKSAQPYEGFLKLIYNFDSAGSGSKQNKEMYYTVNDIKKGQILKTGLHGLKFDEKGNKLEFGNQYDSILVEDNHEKVLPEFPFGSAKLNKNKDKWIYVAKKKIPKTKNYFQGGSGKSVFVPDFGQTLSDITQIGIFIWDLKLKKIVPINIKVENEQTKYIFADPIFSNNEGTKFMCRGHKVTEFGHGFINHFNLPIDIFEVSVEEIGLENMKVNCKRIAKKYKTNFLVTISPCFNYMMYYGGTDIVHAFYMDLIILRKRGEGDDSNYEEGYDKEWMELHKVKEEFVGYENHAKAYSFMCQNLPFAYYQLVENSVLKIKCINMATGEMKVVTNNQIGQQYEMLTYDKEQQLLTGTMKKHDCCSFFYINTSDHKVNIIPPLNCENFKIEEFKDPIHGFLVDSNDIDEEFKKEKKPLYVIVHGGPHGYCDPSLTLLKYMLLKCGYMILYPCFSGTIGFGQSFVKGAVGNIGQVDSKQILQLIKNVCNAKENIDKDRIHIGGGSYGGYMTAIMGSRYPQHFKSCIISNGLISVVGNFWGSDIPEWSAVEAINSEEYHKLKQEDFLKMQELSINSPMKIPTLQFIGGKDRRVPFRQGLLFDAITKKNGIPIETYLYDDEGHSLRESVQTTIDIALKSMQFLQGIKIQGNKI